MKLLIVESPTKSKKISEILRKLKKDIKVVACCGHVRDLDRKQLSVDIQDKFAPKFVPMQNKNISLLRKSIKDSSEVIIGSDNDIEGEAIAWHIVQMFRIAKRRYSRITFNEITEAAIKKALDNPRHIDMNIVDAQICRRIVDRLVGYKLSPLLWKQIDSSASAGRVQSAVLNMICLKDEKINSFKDTSEWYLFGTISRVKFILHLKEKKLTMNNEDEIKCLLQKITNELHIESISNIDYVHQSPTAYNTSKLQQDSYTNNGFDSSYTMKIAQELYENGYITYMRTSSHNICKEATEEIHGYINEKYGKKYCKFPVQDTKNDFAHEAIRPTDINLIELDTESIDHKKLYSMIWRRTIASLMSDAIYDNMTIQVKDSGMDSNFSFIGNIKRLKFNGWLVLYGYENETKEVRCFNNCTFDDNKIIAKNVAKQPPKHYTNSSIIHSMEVNGIGRASTFASIIEKLHSRKYIKNTNISGKKIPLVDYEYDTCSSQTFLKTYETTIGNERNVICPTDIGKKVNLFLVRNFDYIIDKRFTSEIENKLDSIINNNTCRYDVLCEFWQRFNECIQNTIRV